MAYQKAGKWLYVKQLIMELFLIKCGYKMNKFSWKQFELKNRTTLFAIIVSKWLVKDNSTFLLVVQSEMGTKNI